MAQLRKIIGKLNATVNEQVAGSIDHNDKFSGGLARESYAGGYLQALYDILALSNDVPPSNSRYWDLLREKETPDAAA